MYSIFKKIDKNWASDLSTISTVSSDLCTSIYRFIYNVYNSICKFYSIYIQFYLHDLQCVRIYLQWFGSIYSVSDLSTVFWIYLQCFGSIYSVLDLFTMSPALFTMSSIVTPLRTWRGARRTGVAGIQGEEDEGDHLTFALASSGCSNLQLSAIPNLLLHEEEEEEDSLTIVFGSSNLRLSGSQTCSWFPVL